MKKKVRWVLVLLISILFFPTPSVLGAPEFNSSETMFDNHKSVMLLIDGKSGAIVDANQAAEAFYGYSRDELLAMKIGAINTLSPEEVNREMEAALLAHRNFFEFKHRLKDGSIRDVEVYSSAVNDIAGNSLLFSIVHDVTLRKQAQQEASQNKLLAIYLLAIIVVMLLIATYLINHLKRAEKSSKDKLKSIFDNMGEGFALHEIIVNPDGVPIDYRFLDVNHAFEVITGISCEMVKNKTVKEVFPDTEAYWIEVYGAVALTGKGTSFTNFAAGLDKYFHVNVYCPLPNYFATIFTDITAERKVQEKIENERKLLETTLHSIGDAVISTDLSGQIEIMNPVAESLTGWTLTEARGLAFKTIFQIINATTKKLCDDPVEKVLKSGKTIGLENDTLLIKRDQTEISIEDSAAPIFDEQGRIRGVVIVFRDCTEKQEKQQKIQYLSYHDQLTGLYNRHFFETEQKRIDVARNLPLTLLMADVNGLKLTNDAFGHETGDALLKSVATILKKECRADDVVARVGGDEFVMLLPNTDRRQAAQLVARIYQAFCNQKRDHIVISVSIGWATKERSDVDIKEVFAQAEDKMYRRKITESQIMRETTIDHIMDSLDQSSLQEKKHSQRVSQFCRHIGQAMGLKEDALAELETLGRMHDIGKIAIDQKMLLKPGRLTADEYTEVKKHPEISYHIFKSVDSYAKIAEAVLSHHERWDGQGYPRGLATDQIPRLARIVAIADAYEAMTAGRPYQPPISDQKAILELISGAGSQFDPDIVSLCQQHPEVFAERD